MPYLLFLKKRQNLKWPSAANYRWRFKSYMTVKKLEFNGTPVIVDLCMVRIWLN